MGIRTVQNQRARLIYATYDRVLNRVTNGTVVREHSNTQKFNRALHHLIIKGEDGENTYVFGKVASNTSVGPQPIEVLRAYVMGYALNSGETINWQEEEATTVKTSNESKDAEKAAKAAEREAKAAEKAKEKETAEKPADPAPVEEKIAAKKGGKGKGKKGAEKTAEPDFVAGEGDDVLEPTGE